MAKALEQGGWRRWLGPGMALGVVAVGMWPAWPYVSRALAVARPHAPDWGLWTQLSPQTQLHIMAALAAVAIGFVILARPKGRGLHKALGWAWVSAMAATAISSLFMTGLNGNSYSLIHLLSGWTIVALPLGILAIRKRNVIGHRRAMLGMFLGGLLIAGALTFLPGRFMFNLFFS
jgi:uncharacterized membrane protein